MSFSIGPLVISEILEFIELRPAICPADLEREFALQNETLNFRADTEKYEGWLLIQDPPTKGTASITFSRYPESEAYDVNLTYTYDEPHTLSDSVLNILKSQFREIDITLPHRLALSRGRLTAPSPIPGIIPPAKLYTTYTDKAPRLIKEALFIDLPLCTLRSASFSVTWHVVGGAFLGGRAMVKPKKSPTG